MDSSLKQKIRIRFEKTAHARFLSHHDLMRLFERIVRRADIPIRMSAGFNPHPRISFPLALGLGIEARNELVEMELCEWMAAKEVRRRVSPLMPPGMSILSAKAIPPRAKAHVAAVVYEVDAPESAAFWEDRIAQVMQAAELPVAREKKGKRRTVDIRPFLLDILYRDATIQVRLRIAPEGTARIEEVLQALLGGPADAVHRRIVRTQLDLIDDEELKRRHAEAP